MGTIVSRIPNRLDVQWVSKPVPRRSGQFQPPQLDTIRMNVGQVVLSLLDKPAFGLPPNTFSRRTAISGDMPRFSFTSSESVVRVTPRAAAASVMLSPKGSMHWRNTKPPGCGGFFIGMGQVSFQW